MQQEIITFGHYAGVPIEWLVLDREGSRRLLLSREVLDAKKYLPDCIYASWQGSAVRSWLNGAFCDAAFDAAEQSRICHATLQTPHPMGEEQTQDRIFLLTRAQVERYFPHPDDRIAQPNAAACRESRDLRDFLSLLPYYQGVRGCWWWLRDLYREPNQAYLVWSDGTFCGEGHYVNYERGIRPALWLA